MRRFGMHLLLDVPGLAESRPSVLKGDKVVVHQGEGRHYEGVVHDVQQETLLLRFNLMFHNTHIAGMRHHVRFTLRRTPMLLMHAAVAPGNKLSASLLFPAPLQDAAAIAAAAASAMLALPAPLFNRNLNARQQQAVRGVLYSGAQVGDTPYIIFRPPGTGKTSTVVEYVLQVVECARRSGIAAGAPAAGGGGGALSALMRGLSLTAPPPPAVIVLVAAPSNSAVDELAVRLVARLRPRELLRVNAYQRSKTTLPESLLPCSLWCSLDGAFLMPQRSDLSGVYVVAATCATAQKLAFAQNGAFEHFFSHVAVDEAGQATEPECMCAIARLLRPASQGGARLLLAGDPKQLGSVLRSAVALEHGLGLSLLERLSERGGPHKQQAADAGLPNGFNPAYVTLLTDNYRSHPALLTVPNERFYGGALVACAEPLRSHVMCAWAGLPEAARSKQGGFPLLFHGVAGEDMREGNSPSWFNPEEATAVLAHVRSVLAQPGTGITQADIGVVSPYHKQVQKIAALLRTHRLDGVTVGSVERFQGGERGVIILFAVRSSQEHVPFDARHALGFLSNPKRFNVAITRARALLIIVGNPAVLALDPHWAALLRHALCNGAYTGCALPPGFDGGAGGGSDDGDDGPEAMLRRVADEEAARAAAADVDGEAAGRADRGMEEGPAWNTED